MVLETLQYHKLYTKASKCRFGSSSVGSLGHVTSEPGVAVDPRKVAAVAEWTTQQSCTNVRRFVGLAKTTASLCCVSLTLATPLTVTALCNPRARFAWGDAVWDPERQTRLVTDASELAVSAILEHPDDASVFHPVAFE